MPKNRPNPAAGRPTGPFPAVPLYIDANGVPTNDPGTDDVPAVGAGAITAPVTVGPGADDTSAAAPVAAAPNTANYDKIISDLKLDPSQWHVVGEPSAAVNPNTGKPATTRTTSTDYTVSIAGPNNQQRLITLRPTGDGVDDPSVANRDVGWNVVKSEESVAPPSATAAVSPQTNEDKAKAETAASQAAADQATQQLKDLQSLDSNRQKNVSSRGLYLTDEEIANMDKSLKDQGLQQAQIDAQLKIASANNQNASISNEIAAQNAKTNADVAASNSRIAEARLGLDTAGLDEQKVRDAEEHAKNVATQELALQTSAQADRKIALDELTQRQTNQISEGTLANAQQTNALRGTEAVETQRHNEATEAQTAAAAKATADAQQQTNVTTAAGDALRTGASNAATGAGLLQNRATTAAGALTSILGTVGSSKIMNVPSDLGANLVGGLGQWVTDLGGGDATMQAAANMVQAADPKISGDPDMAKQATQAISQIFQQYQQTNGHPAPPVAAVQAAQASQPNGGVTAPVTTAPAAPAAAATTQPTTAVQQTTAPGAPAAAPLAPAVDFNALQGRQKVDAALQALQAKAMPFPGAQANVGVGVANPYANFISPVTA